MLENWTQKLNSGVSNSRASGWLTPANYTGSLQVIGFKKATATVTDEESGDTTEDAAIASSYKFWGAWPSSVGEVTLDWETNDIQEYEVTWEYAYWTKIQ
jgi:hypothetical protein